MPWAARSGVGPSLVGEDHAGNVDDNGFKHIIYFNKKSDFCFFVLFKPFFKYKLVINSLYILR